MYSSGAKWGWLSVALASVVTLMLLGALAGQAHAAVYWANGGGISRMNLDGTNPSPGLVGGESDPLGTPCGLAVDASHLYWADKFGNRIGRSGLDGSNREDDFIDGADEPCGVAVSDGYIYWANYGGNSIGRAKMDGSDVDQEFVHEAPDACGVAVSGASIYWAGRVHDESGYRDVVGRALLASGETEPNVFELESSYGYCGVAAAEGHVYWGGWGDAIGRVGVDGSDPEPRFLTGLQSPCSVAIGEGKLYFGAVSAWNGAGPIGRANLDGSGLESQIAAAMRPCGIAVDSLAFGPSYVAVPPLPQLTPCEIDAVRASKRRDSALVRLEGPAYGHLAVTTRGLSWRLLPKKPPPSGGSVQASWRWWLQMWPGRRGRVARRLRRRLARTGKAPITVRVRCSEDGRATNSASRKLVLHKPVRHRHSSHSRRHRRVASYH